MIKSIETKYKGYRFRSRLEARWAVFFDEVGIKWEYEPEGFQTSIGNYLPDFFLIDLNMYAEVKHDNGNFEKALCFSRESEKSILLCEGVPDFKFYFYTVPEMVAIDNIMQNHFFFCGAYEFDQAIDEHRFFSCPGYCINNNNCNSKNPQPYPADEEFFSYKYKKAIQAVRSKRFEFGE